LRGSKSDGKGAGQALILLADQYPDYLVNVDPILIEWVVRQLDQEEKEGLPGNVYFDLSLAFARAGYGQAGTAPTLGKALLLHAIDGLARRDRFKEARELLPRITGSQDILALMVDHRFTPLWADLDTLAGPGLTRAMQHEAEISKTLHDADSNNAKNLAEYLAAEVTLRTPENAMAEAEKALANTGFLESQGGDAYFLRRIYALALDEVGRTDEAFAQFKQLESVDPSIYRQWSATMIDYGQMLLRNDRFADALSVVATMEQKPDMTFSAHVWGGAMAIKACALALTGRQSEAMEAVEASGRHGADLNYLPMAWACLGKATEASIALNAQLEDEEARGYALTRLQDFSRTPASSRFVKEMDEIFGKIEGQDPLKSYIAKLGRVVSVDSPKSLWTPY
jgi:tetratricopeptide (TPR) repeat protein